MPDPTPFPPVPDANAPASATHRVYCRVGGRRYEVALAVETREVRAERAEVIEMPERETE
jgi:hypothetical protein